MSYIGENREKNTTRKKRENKTERIVWGMEKWPTHKNLAEAGVLVAVSLPYPSYPTPSHCVVVCV